MELQHLSVKRRTESGKGPARRARAQGQIPAVLYGEGGDTVSLTVDGITLGHVLHGRQGEHAIVQLEVEDAPDISGPAIVKTVQHHPVRDDVLHADFMRIRLDEKITTYAPIVVTGRSVGVLEGGLLDHQLRELEIECLALDVPEEITVDITELGIGDAIHVEELNIPAGVTPVTPPERAVVAVLAPRVVEEAAEGEEEEGVEGEEGAEETTGEAAEKEGESKEE